VTVVSLPGRRAGREVVEKLLTSAMVALSASEGDGLHAGLGSLLESFRGRLAAEAAVGAVVVVEVLPFLELVVEDLGVVDHHPVQQLVELLSVDTVGAFDAPMLSSGCRLLGGWA